MEQRQNDDGDVFAAGRHYTEVTVEAPVPAGDPEGGEPEDACDGEPTVSRRTLRVGDTLVNQEGHAGRDLYMTGGSMTVIRHD